MWARVARYEVSPDRLDEARDAFEEGSQELGGLEGARGGYLLVDRESGAAITFTLWESYDAMCRSEVPAASLRRRAIGAVDGGVQAVECFEVAVEFEQVRQALA
jgi:hypothetical protein